MKLLISDARLRFCILFCQWTCNDGRAIEVESQRVWSSKWWVLKEGVRVAWRRKCVMMIMIKVRIRRMLSEAVLRQVCY